MRYLIFLFFITCFYTSSMAVRTNYPPQVKKMLLSLDSTLVHKDKYIMNIEKKVSLLEEKKKSRNISPLQRFLINEKIYNIIYVFNSDSAMHYANENIALATYMHKPDLTAEWTINKSFILSATGLLKESYDVLKAIKVDALNRQLRMKYYTQAVYLYSHMALYLTESSALRNEYMAKEAIFSDSLNALCQPTDPLYLWYKGWRYRDNTARRRTIIRQLKKKLSACPMNTRTDAMLAYVLARLCEADGERDNYLMYLAYSGIADIRSANRDIASIEELARELFNMGDLDRAYTYISFCQQNALFYKNRVRVVSIANMQNTIWQAYQKKSMAQERRLGLFTIVLALLLVVLLGAIMYIRQQMKRLSRSQIQLKQANTLQKKQMEELETIHKFQAQTNLQLKELNDQLRMANNSLQEANVVKEEYISHLFIFCSNYIKKLDSYRKTINREIKAEHYSNIKKLTGSESMVQDELKEFYHNFDMIFLHLYPDFIKDFNNLLSPEARFELKADNTLNTQLRIYALVRLGINDSVKIAEFLHCSPQTVYNYRLKTRNCAIIPKDEFAYTVRRLGKIQVQ